MKLWCVYHSADTEPFIKVNLFSLGWLVRLWKRVEIVLQFGVYELTLKEARRE